jgi:hypothetical protein
MRLSLQPGLNEKLLEKLHRKRRKREKEKSEKRFGEMIETLTFAPRSKRGEAKKREEGKEQRKQV